MTCESPETVGLETTLAESSVRKVSLVHVWSSAHEPQHPPGNPWNSTI